MVLELVIALFTEASSLFCNNNKYKLSLRFCWRSILRNIFSFSGILAGNILALTLSFLELRFHFITLPEKSYFITYVPLLIEPVDYAVVSSAVLALTLLFAFIPAMIASRLQPETAMST